MAARKGLLWDEKLGIDSTTSQANASTKSIVRKDSGKGWKDYTKKLAKRRGSAIRPMQNSDSSARNARERRFRPTIGKTRMILTLGSRG